MSDATPTIRVFTAEDCGRCPAAVDVVRTIAEERNAHVEVLDAEEDRREALRQGVLAVPTVVVGDEQIRGVPERDQLERALERATA